MFRSKVSQTSRNLCNRTATLQTESIRFFLKVTVYPTKSRYSSQTMPRRRAHRISAFPIGTHCMLRFNAPCWCVRRPRTKARRKQSTTAPPRTFAAASHSQFHILPPLSALNIAAVLAIEGLRPSKAKKDTRSSPLQCRPQCC